MTGQLDAAKKSAATVQAPAPANTEELVRLRGELANTKAELAVAKTAVAAPPVANGDAEEVKQLRAELVRAKADAELAKKIGGKPTITANEELNQLRPAYARARAEAEEYKRLAARAELDRAERAAMARHLADLEHTNAQLRDQIGSVKSQPATKAVVPAKPAVVEPEKSTTNIVTTGKPVAGNEEIAKLRAELADAKTDAEKSRQAVSRVNDLERENKSLANQLAEARKAPMITPAAVPVIPKAAPVSQNFGASATEAPQPVTKPVESTELKRLRADLADAKADAQKAHTAHQAEIAKLQQQTKDLASQLDAAKKATAIEPPELKKLRAELTDAKANSEKALNAQQTEVARLQQQTKALATQLDAAKKASSAQPIESPELKKLRAELTDAKADADKARAAQQRETAKLQQQNADLIVQLTAAKQISAAKPGESAELKKTTADLADAKAALNKIKSDLTASNKANHDELTALQNKNKALAADLEAAKKQPSKSDEVTKLRKEVDTAWAEAEKFRQVAAHVRDLESNNKALTAQLAEARKAQSDASKTVPTVQNFGGVTTNAPAKPAVNR